ncbi:TIGR03086 family metal-binding protein [Pseudonocardia sp. HH130630-07]|uniref:TIGR03086 family metal-binding protein n=1 Tax=Pseudonocardia sp. HH130630-07 TaxID=1690815 RepID=UPI000814F215|nr:TIGR03086 family metal-binding protein [Pseudonocardia sp. HH130630-07]ANY05583.1 hypothetical protein AFB00_03850 [Pseudonocardia sp. HH130630-07]
MPIVFELHHRSVAAVRAVTDRIVPADLDRPTPCAGWDLRALLEHMTGQDHGFAAAVTAAQHGSDTDAAAFGPRPLSPSPAADVAGSLATVTTTVAAAEGLDRPVLLPEFGSRVPLPTLVSMHLVDTLVHGWDVATALGAADAYSAGLDDDLVGRALSIAEQVPTERDDPGLPFGPVHAGAGATGPWSRTLALLGRDPGRPVPS